MFFDGQQHIFRAAGHEETSAAHFLRRKLLVKQNCGADEDLCSKNEDQAAAHGGNELWNPFGKLIQCAYVQAQGGESDRRTDPKRKPHQIPQGEDVRPAQRLLGRGVFLQHLHSLGDTFFFGSAEGMLRRTRIHLFSSFCFFLSYHPKGKSQGVCFSIGERGIFLLQFHEKKSILVRGNAFPTKKISEETQ